MKDSSMQILTYIKDKISYNLLYEKERAIKTDY